VLTVNEIDMMYILWPASLILTTGWRTTVPGITLTVISVLLNSITYAVLAVLLRAISQFALGLIGQRSAP